MALWAVFVLVDKGLHQTVAAVVVLPSLLPMVREWHLQSGPNLMLGLQLCTRRLLRSSILCTGVPPGFCRLSTPAALPF